MIRFFFVAAIGLLSPLSFAGSPLQVLNQPKEIKVSIVEFSDFQCPFCKAAAGTIEQVLKVYGNSVQVVFRNFPLSFHENAHAAAIAGVCAHDQGQFKGMHDFLFAHQDKLSRDTYVSGAASLKLDAAAFAACLDSEAASQRVDSDLANGLSFGVDGTPTFFLNGNSKTIRMAGAYPFAEFKKAIDSLLAK